MIRDIVTLWATRKSIDAGFHPPELVEAWDEFSIEENFEGWHNACKDGLAAMGDDLDQYRYITLRIQESVFERAFFTSVSSDVDARESGPNGEALGE